MGNGAPKPKYIVDESGNKSAVVLSMEDYERLLAAWEEVVDAADFATARKSTKKFISTDNLRRRVLRNK